MIKATQPERLFRDRLQLKQKEIIDLINTIVPDWDRDNYINIVLSNENESDLDIVRNRLIRLFGGKNE